MAETPRSIGLLLLPDFSQLGFAAVTEPLFVANWLSGRELYRWRSLSLERSSCSAASAFSMRAMR